MILALALAATAIAPTQSQVTSYDGCTKNCAYCMRYNQILPSPGISSRTCDACINSSPKKILPMHYDCSGPAIPNCEVHFVNKTTDVVSCFICKNGFKIKTVDKVDTCEAMPAEFTNCLRANSEFCTACKNDHSLERTTKDVAFSKACSANPVEQTLRIANCQTYQTTSSPKETLCAICLKIF